MRDDQTERQYRAIWHSLSLEARVELVELAGSVRAVEPSEHLVREMQDAGASPGWLMWLDPEDSGAVPTPLGFVAWISDGRPFDAV